MKRTSLLFAVLGLLACPVATPSLQRCIEPVESRIVDGIELTITSDENSFPLGEPIRLRLTLRNCTPKAVDIADSGPLASYVFEVFDDQGRHVGFTDEGTGIEEMRRSNGNHGLEIPAGETATDELDISRWFDLSRPGRYTLRARRRLVSVGRDDPVRLVSNDLTIDVMRQADRSGSQPN